MNKNEAIIASAYTGGLFPGVNFSDLHEAIEKKMCRPIFTHQFADEKIMDEIKDRFKIDFIEMDITNEN